MNQLSFIANLAIYSNSSKDPRCDICAKGLYTGEGRLSFNELLYVRPINNPDKAVVVCFPVPRNKEIQSVLSLKQHTRGRFRRQC